MKSPLTGRDSRDWPDSLVGDEAEYLRHLVASDPSIDNDTRLSVGFWLNGACDLWLAGHDQAALAELIRAWNWLGLVQGMAMPSKRDSARWKKEAMSAFGSMGAHAKHAENRSLQAQVVDHYTTHRARYKSKDAAAEDMAGKLVPVKFRTVRKWLSGLPPAGKA